MTRSAHFDGPTKKGSNIWICLAMAHRKRLINVCILVLFNSQLLA